MAEIALKIRHEYVTRQRSSDRKIRHEIPYRVSMKDIKDRISKEFLPIIWISLKPGVGTDSL
jgi:hypothetical protein